MGAQAFQYRWRKTNLFTFVDQPICIRSRHFILLIWLISLKVSSLLDAVFSRVSITLPHVSHARVEQNRTSSLHLLFCYACKLENSLCSSHSLAHFSTAALVSLQMSDSVTSQRKCELQGLTFPAFNLFFSAPQDLEQATQPL